MIMRGKFEYKAGDTARIKSGPFALFTGGIIEVNMDEAAPKVSVKFQNEWRLLKLRFPGVEKAPTL
jgi:transcription antitermination factor NusG